MTKGKSMDEVADFMEANFDKFGHVVVVDDLNHLHRGGRVSKTTAIVGSLANIKPIIHVDDEGHLITIGKIRGRRKALAYLVDLMEEKMENHLEFIFHQIRHQSHIQSLYNLHQN